MNKLFTVDRNRLFDNCRNASDERLAEELKAECRRGISPCAGREWRNRWAGRKIGRHLRIFIDPLAGSNPNDPDSQLSVQQSVSGNLLLSFSTDVTSTQNQAVQLQYEVKLNVSLSVLQDQNGGYAIDIRVRTIF